MNCLYQPLPKQQIYEQNKSMLFKPLSFGVVCYIIDNCNSIDMTSKEHPKIHLKNEFTILLGVFQISLIKCTYP